MSSVEIGYWMSSEEHGPTELVRNAIRAEEIGFTTAMISDHFHPWLSAQGHSPFVWSVLGAIAHATERLEVGTGVTAPIMRMHPAIVAHAAATVAAMMPGRFFLGVGTGERLNEHVHGDHWPEPDRRREMLEEAVDVIRRLWTGQRTTFYGRFYTVEEAELYTRTEQAPAIVVAGSSKSSARLAGRIGDGYVGVAPEAEHIETFEEAGGRGKPKYGQVSLCWAEDEEAARRTAHHYWANAGLQGSLSTELARPMDFEAATALVRPDDVAESVPCGPDPDRHLGAIAAYIDAGYDHVYLHQVGPDQAGFFRFWEEELRPRLAQRADVAVAS